MGSTKPRSGTSSYKSMNGRGSSAPSQLTVSRLEKVPEVDTGYTVNRLLSDNPHNRVQTPTGSHRGRNGKPPTGRQHYGHPQIESADPGEMGDMESVANMSMMTVTGAVIGPTANTLTPGRSGGGGLLDFFAGPADTSSVLDSSIMAPPPIQTTEESDIM